MMFISSDGSMFSPELTHKKITQIEKHPHVLDYPSADYINCSPVYISFWEILNDPFFSNLPAAL